MEKLFPLREPNHCMETLYHHEKGYIVNKWSFHCINYSVADCLKAWLKDTECSSVILQDLTQFLFQMLQKKCQKCSVVLALRHLFCFRTAITETVYVFRNRKACIGKLSPDHADIVSGFVLQSLTVGRNTQIYKTIKTNNETNWIQKTKTSTIKNSVQQALFCFGKNNPPQERWWKSSPSPTCLVSSPPFKLIPKITHCGASSSLSSILPPPPLSTGYMTFLFRLGWLAPPADERLEWLSSPATR